MAFTPEVSSINQRIQVGAESTSALGTAVAAGKLLECFDIVFGIVPEVKFYRPTGHKYPSVQEENQEWGEGTLGGILDYNGVIYPLAGVMGSVSPVTHGVSATAKDWIFVPPILGSIVPQTYTFQQGDAVRARQFAYGLFTEFAYKGTRKEFTNNGKLLAQAISDGITLTASPTAVALAPVVAKQVNVYLDTTSAGIGTTQLLRTLSLDYMMTGVYGPFWPLNRSNISYTGHVDLEPKTTIKIMEEANAEGMAMLGYLQTGTTYYMRVQALGLVIDNLQTVSLGAPSAGTFTLTYKAQTTATIAFNATAAAVQSALAALSSIPAGTVAVTGSAGGPYNVVFSGSLAQDTTAMTGSGTGLTGGTFLITQNQTNNTFQHDMAVKFGKPTPFKDDSGIFAIEWEATIVEDPNWGASGTSQKLTVTNLITAL